MHYIKGIIFTRGFQIIALTFDKHLDNCSQYIIQKVACVPLTINGIKDML